VISLRASEWVSFCSSLYYLPDGPDFAGPGEDYPQITQITQILSQDAKARREQTADYADDADVRTAESA
jgi:hypothetical protein